MPYCIEKYTDNINNQFCQQAIVYYDYCRYIRNFTEDTMRGKTTSINHLIRYIKPESLESITNDVVMQWIALQAKAGNKSRTINNRVKHLRAMVKYYEDEHNLVNHKLNLARIKKQFEETPNRRAYSRETIYETLHYADRQVWLMIKICFDCGLRVMELQKMRLRDIDGPKLLVHGKGRKNRLAILDDDVLVRLQDYIKQYQITDYVWPSPRLAGRPLNTDFIRRKMKETFAAAGIADFCPHELRHSYATDLKNLGASTRSIQFGLGHTSEKITEMYLHDLCTNAIEELYKLKYSAAAPELR